MNPVRTFLNNHKIQLVQFFIVGLIIFCINLASFHISYSIVQLNYTLAASMAYIITVLAHFLLHRRFTFAATQQNVASSVWKYLVMLGLNYLILLFVMWLAVDVIKTSAYFGLIASTVMTACINFFMMKYFVFS